MEKYRYGIGDEHPGSATLPPTIFGEDAAFTRDGVNYTSEEVLYLRKKNTGTGTTLICISLN
jgi:hypothetical protein